MCEKCTQEPKVVPFFQSIIGAISSNIIMRDPMLQGMFETFFQSNTCSLSWHVYPPYMSPIKHVWDLARDLRPTASKDELWVWCDGLIAFSTKNSSRVLWGRKGKFFPTKSRSEA
ncbi:hypothetical protein TNCV_4230041 [Trichonephila clavipes]|uniref:Uncharacterized protein n=1 Tax=Trichonephila clavipes TaxID=2585209 RepID=A0A8X6SHY6_TRICX|nr:hypothetical protein TNCV_4230041 [Trichonephila clavipes]